MTLDLKSGDPLPNWQPARSLPREVLAGTIVRLEPIDSGRHAAALFDAQADGDPYLWDYMPVGPFESLAAFDTWLKAIEPSPDPLFYAIVDQMSGQPQGMASYLRITPAHGVIEIGFIWFGAALQRTRGATEAIYLLARHAFDDLGYRRFEWKCNALNQRSRRAAERFGFTFEGVFRQHMVVKGRNRDTAWYSILDGEWPIARAAFEQWLAPDNFDAGSQQRRSLAELRDAIQTN